MDWFLYDIGLRRERVNFFSWSHRKQQNYFKKWVKVLDVTWTVVWELFLQEVSLLYEVPQLSMLP